MWTKKVRRFVHECAILYCLMSFCCDTAFSSPGASFFTSHSGYIYITRLLQRKQIVHYVKTVQPSPESWDVFSRTDKLYLRLEKNFLEQNFENIFTASSKPMVLSTSVTSFTEINSFLSSIAKQLCLFWWVYLVGTHISQVHQFTAENRLTLVEKLHYEDGFHRLLSQLSCHRWHQSARKSWRKSGQYGKCGVSTGPCLGNPGWPNQKIAGTWVVAECWVNLPPLAGELNSEAVPI